MKNVTDMQDFLKRVEQHNLYEGRFFEVANPGVDKIFIRAETEGASGGSCWDEDAVEDYYISQNEIKKEIESELVIQLNQLRAELRLPQQHFDNVCAKFSQSALEQEIATTTESEYYGNYTRFNLYSIDLNALMSEVMSKEDFAIFSSLLGKNKEVEQSTHDIERQHIVNQIAVLQSHLESFDKGSIMTKGEVVLNSTVSRSSRFKV